MTGFLLIDKIGTAAIRVDLYPLGNIMEWDYESIFSSASDDFVFTGDYDNDGIKEIYAFTLSNDAIYPHMISVFSNPKPRLNRFITIFGQL